MIQSNQQFLQPELMDVVRLFEGAEALAIEHEMRYEEGVFYNRFLIDGEEFCFSACVKAEGALAYKSQAKRQSKLALYRLLKERFQKSLPWGALTGIRPTRLAYMEEEQGRDFENLFREMDVSEQNIALIRRVLQAQEGIYRRKEGDCDLYVSLPFCPTRCSYCSFITAPIDKTRAFIPDYLRCLERELEGLTHLIGNLRSIYIGGGTPFALSEQELEQVLKAVAPFYREGCEYTVEAGRADVFSEEKLALCKRYGVTRLCVNAQSFSDKTLQTIGRKHTAQQVIDAFAMAKPYGILLNCDLIAGLTGESLEEFKNSIDQAIALSPENITVHTLCLKRGARLKEETESLGEGELSDMIAYSRERLTKAGYEPYYLYRQKYMAGAHENVGWAKRGCASVYNIDVMEESTNNLAVGANAISKRVILGEGRIERIGSPKDIPTYINKVEQLVAEKNALFGDES